MTDDLVPCVSILVVENSVMCLVYMVAFKRISLGHDLDEFIPDVLSQFT